MGLSVEDGGSFPVDAGPVSHAWTAIPLLPSLLAGARTTSSVGFFRFSDVYKYVCISTFQ